jgi:hypothetical protein
MLLPLVPDRTQPAKSKQVLHGSCAPRRLTHVASFHAEQTPSRESDRTGHDVPAAYCVQVGNSLAVWPPLRAGKPDRLTELMSAATGDEGSLGRFIGDRQLGSPVAIEVGGRTHANPGLSCPTLAEIGEYPLLSYQSWML